MIKEDLLLWKHPLGLILAVELWKTKPFQSSDKNGAHSSAHKQHCWSEEAGAACTAMPREPEGGETGPKHARITESRGKQELPALYYWWAGEKGGVGSRENMAAVDTDQASTKANTIKGSMKILILLWRKTSSISRNEDKMWKTLLCFLKHPSENQNVLKGNSSFLF